MTSDFPESRSASGSTTESTGLTLYDEYSVRIWRYVARLIGADSHAVADAVQETFLAVIRSGERYDPARGTHWAWISSIAHRQAALYWRKAGRLPQFDQASLDREDGRGNSPELELDRAETSQSVRQILATMPAESSLILTAKYADGMSVAEIVEQFGGTTEAVRSRLARARRDFRSRYLQHFSDSDESGETTQPRDAAATSGGDRR